MYLEEKFKGEFNNLFYDENYINRHIIKIILNHISLNIIIIIEI